MGEPAEAMRVPLSGKSGNEQRISICAGSVLRIRGRQREKEEILDEGPSDLFDSLCWDGSSCRRVGHSNSFNQHHRRKEIPITEEMRNMTAAGRKKSLVMVADDGEGVEERTDGVGSDE